MPSWKFLCKYYFASISLYVTVQIIKKKNMWLHLLPPPPNLQVYLYLAILYCWLELSEVSLWRRFNVNLDTPLMGVKRTVYFLGGKCFLYPFSCKAARNSWHWGEEARSEALFHRTVLVLPAICTFLCRMVNYGLVLENFSQGKPKDDSCFLCAISDERYALKLNREGGEKWCLFSL